MRRRQAPWKHDLHRDNFTKKRGARVKVGIFALAIFVLLTACRGASDSPTPTLYALPTLAPTDDVQTPTAAAIPVPVTPSITPTEIPDYTGCTMEAIFIDDVTVPDNQPIDPGAEFTKIWRMQNIGNCDWRGGINLVFQSGDQMEGEPIPVPDTPAGGTVDIALNLVAPVDPGLYTGIWRLQMQGGDVFGTEPYVRIFVPRALVGPETDLDRVGCVLDSLFVSDVTIPDNTVLEPGEAFTKTWRILNSSSCDWGEGFKLVFQGGEDLNKAGEVPVPLTRAWTTVDLSVEMTAPASAETYVSVWGLQAPDGTLFGINPFVQFVVEESIPVTATTTPMPTATPRSSAGTPQPTQRVTPTPSPTPLPAASATPVALSGFPIISGITGHAHEIYQRGQALGNNPNVIAKVGDSLTDNIYFLYPIGDGNYDLHSYDYLQSAVSFFVGGMARAGNSFGNISLAAKGGWNSDMLVDPEAADLMCDEGLTPVQCEYIFSKPSVAIIMIGTNDGDWKIGDGSYQANLSSVVESSIEMGVIPVLSTIPWNKFRDPAPYNTAIITVARTYNVPLVDFYSVVDHLPNRGVGEDGVHLSIPPGGESGDFSSNNLQYGYTMRNLVTLQVLDAVWRQAMY
ncbi:MAG: hypothetical protein JXJ17_14805 [Anaerolineae bacterium]|nr:hypothetical protein [Anaerolineae bacterium]